MLARSKWGMQLKWHLSHIRGYLELGLVAEAAAEFAEIDASLHDRSEVLKIAVCVFHEQENWRRTQGAAAELCRREPGDAAWWITLAYATRRADSIEQAEAILLAAEKLHPREATIAFNLGCYACQRGDLQKAQEYLTAAIGLNEEFRAAAETDPDLAALRKK
jgi:Flp pilus assembly protein TadD